MSKNFALIGAAGYIAPRHLRAIKDTGNRIVAAVDPHDSVGILDQYSSNTSFFTEIERFDRHLEKLRRGPEKDKVSYISICSPNYLHDAHCRLALRLGADVICEKPLVINPWNLEPLKELEAETGHKINTVLQLRLLPALVKLREETLLATSSEQHDVSLTYITTRGPWYHTSWKGIEEKSGGIVTNIGIHLFDLLIWLFGSYGDVRVFYSDSKRISGFIDMENARVTWFLSIDAADLPEEVTAAGKKTYRSIIIDGSEIEFSEGFTDLHTEIYRQILQGKGFGIDDARPSIQLTHHIRTSQMSKTDNLAHPLLKKLQE